MQSFIVTRPKMSAKQANRRGYRSFLTFLNNQKFDITETAKYSFNETDFHFHFILKPLAC
jgi:hypothetical protein